jgi:hypothetical protein
MGTVNVLEAARVTGIKRVVVSSSSVLNRYPEGGEDGGDFGKEEAFPRLAQPRFTPLPSRRWRTSVSITPSGAGSSSLGCGTGRCSAPGAALAAADLRMLFARRCAVRSAGKRQFSRQAQWSGSIPRMRPAVPPRGTRRRDFVPWLFGRRPPETAPENLHKSRHWDIGPQQRAPRRVGGG